MRWGTGGQPFFRDYFPPWLAQSVVMEMMTHLFAAAMDNVAPKELGSTRRLAFARAEAETEREPPPPAANEGRRSFVPRVVVFVRVLAGRAPAQA